MVNSKNSHYKKNKIESFGMRIGSNEGDIQIYLANIHQQSTWMYRKIQAVEGNIYFKIS